MQYLVEPCLVLDIKNHLLVVVADSQVVVAVAADFPAVAAAVDPLVDGSINFEIIM